MITKRLAKPIMIGAAATAIVAGVGIYAYKEEHRPRILEIYVFALKTGRSVFIRTPEDKRILIDGGGNSDIIRELTRILPFYSRRIDAIIATNSDGKNASGLIDIAGRYAIDHAYTPAMTAESLGLASSTDQIYSTLIETLKRLKIPIHEARAGDLIAFDPSVSAKVIFPAPYDSFPYSKASAPEILLQITYRSSVITLLYDATKKVQAFQASQDISNSDVLYISQSAAPDSLSSDLMRKLNPEYLIYSKAVAKALAKPAKASRAKISPKRKEGADPLASILDDNRFNLKESGNILITVAGNGLSIKKAP